MNTQDYKILIADDEKDVLDIVQKRLAAEGYQVLTAEDGLQTWEAIKNESPDVILLDLNMPGMHGFEILKRLRKENPCQKWQPVVIISGQGELGDMQKGFDLEADHYLTKPCKIEDILRAVRLMLQLIPIHKSN